MMKIGVSSERAREISGHSGRSTLATELANQDAGIPKLQIVGGWASSDMPKRYVRNCVGISKKSRDNLFNDHKICEVHQMIDHFIFISIYSHK